MPEKIERRLTGLLLICLAVMLVGCESRRLAQSGASDFQVIWNSYTQCQSASDMDSIREASKFLNKAASSVAEGPEFVLPLPAGVARHIVQPSHRFAVDPKAVAAACSLHVAERALDMGNSDLAKDRYQSVLNLFGEPEYAYYRAQAIRGLSHINLAITVSPSSGLRLTSR
jgi:hypothetical protein